MTGIQKAIKQFGSMKKLAESVGVTRQAVKLWQENGSVPQKKVFDVERATGIPIWELNPEVYPKQIFKQAS